MRRVTDDFLCAGRGSLVNRDDRVSLVTRDNYAISGGRVSRIDRTCASFQRGYMLRAHCVPALQSTHFPCFRPVAPGDGGV